MKLDTLKEYPMTGDVYTVVNQDEAGVITYGFDRSIRMKMITSGARTHLITDERLITFSEVRNIKDPNGVDIYPGKSYRVSAVVPVMNVFGYVEETTYIMSGTGT